MGPQRRWVHVVGAVVALALVLGLFLLVQRPSDELTSPVNATPVPTPTPPPSDSVPGGAAATLAPLAPTGPSLPGVPSVPALPSITIPPLDTCPDPDASAPLRVVTFNIHGGRTADSSSYDIARIVEEIRSFDADVVLMQEVHRFKRFSGFDDQPALLGESLGMTPTFGLTYSRNPEGPGQPRRESGNLILSRLPVLDSGIVALPNQPGLEQRALLHIDVKVGDQQVRVYDTHLQHTSAAVRVLQAQAVRDQVRLDPGPFVLGGDFNTTSGARAFAIMKSIATDTWPEIGTTDGFTVPARAPRARIDYVMHGNGAWVPRQAQTFYSAVSDHRAVVVDFDLPLLDPCAAP